VDVDGDVFNVKISLVWSNEQKSAAAEMPEPERESQIPEGAVLCGMAGLVLSIEVKAGDRVGEGDLLATIEAMKMRRRILASRKGVVKEVRAREGEIVNSGDVLVVLE
jgi:biotin carboxyl carrier protein